MWRALVMVFSLTDAICVYASSENLRQLSEQLESNRKQSRFVEAARVATAMLDITEKEFGLEGPETADAVYTLEWAYVKAGDTVLARQLHHRTVSLMEKTRGRASAKTIDLFNQLGWAYYPRDASTAESFFLRALEAAEQNEGANGAAVGQTLFNLGIFYHDLHDYARARTLLERALAVNQAARGPDDVQNASICHFLGLAHQSLWNLDQAQDYYEKALHLLEGKSGHEALVAAHCMNSFGGLCRERGNLARAEQLHLRALNIMEEQAGADESDIAYVLAALAGLYELTGDYAKAEPLFARALDINQRYWGREHEKTLAVLRNWTRLEMTAGHTNEALALILKARPGTEFALETIFSFAPATERLAFKNYEDLIGPLATLGDAKNLAETLLHYKGVVTDSLLQDRRWALRSQDPEVRALVAEFSKTQEQLEALPASVVQEKVGENLLPQRNRAFLEQRLQQIESSLARRAGSGTERRTSFSTTLAQIQQVLEPDWTLLEQIRYHRYLGKGKWQYSYGVIVITARDKPQWVDLGSAEEIDKNLRLFQHSVRQAGDTLNLRSVLQNLYGQLWAPVAPRLPKGAQNIIVCPDADLSFVSFAALLAPSGRFLGERFLFSYIARVRDLLQSLPPSGSNSLHIWANPDFGMGLSTNSQTAQGPFVSRSGLVRDLRGFKFGPLPGAERESRLLQSRSGELGFRQVYLHLGKAATESELRRLQSPAALHLATHGFALEPDQPDKEGGRTWAGLRSGLALAGAQQTIEAWSKGTAPPVQGDGILTAEEVSTLNLEGTRLVVLSACESGMGRATSGEGVSGMRRAFLEAGARNLVLTLWPIDDEQTSSLMLDFYRAYHTCGNAPLALGKIQREWLIRLRKEKGAAEACRIAGPFIPSFQGKPGASSN